MTEDCQVWNVPAASGTARQVTVSSIPTLVLNGSFDERVLRSGEPFSWHSQRTRLWLRCRAQGMERWS